MADGGLLLASRAWDCCLLGRSHGRCFVVVDACPKKDILSTRVDFDGPCRRGTQWIGLRRPDDVLSN